jgi:hypothetical protein
MYIIPIIILKTINDITTTPQMTLLFNLLFDRSCFLYLTRLIILNHYTNYFHPFDLHPFDHLPFVAILSRLLY